MLRAAFREQEAAARGVHAAGGGGEPAPAPSPPRLDAWPARAAHPHVLRECAAPQKEGQLAALSLCLDEPAREVVEERAAGDSNSNSPPPALALALGAARQRGGRGAGGRAPAQETAPPGGRKQRGAPSRGAPEANGRLPVAAVAPPGGHQEGNGLAGVRAYESSVELGALAPASPPQAVPPRRGGGLKHSASEANLAQLEPAQNKGPIALGLGTALMLVDLQPVYWSECAAVQEAFPQLPANVAGLLTAARSAGSEVIHVRAAYTREQCPWLPHFERLNPGRKQYEVFPEAIEPWAAPLPGETIVDKDTFGAFVHAPDLAPSMRARGVHTVVVAGLITSVCVQHTVFGAFNAGFRVAVAHDACGDRSMERHKAAIRLYGGYMYEVVATKDVVERTRKVTEAEQRLQVAPEPLPLADQLSVPPTLLPDLVGKPALSPDTCLGVSLSQVSLVDYCQQVIAPRTNPLRSKACHPSEMGSAGCDEVSASLPSPAGLHLTGHLAGATRFKQHALLEAETNALTGQMAAAAI